MIYMIGVHPTEAAADKMAQVWFDSLKKVLDTSQIKIPKNKQYLLRTLTGFDFYEEFDYELLDTENNF